ncbi:MAG: TRAM domain-containing protein [Bdellovibrionales bacterium]|nr:TRAM domain-containing protein [Bdellovibrionales bacterium]
MPENSLELELTVEDLSRSGPGVARDSGGRVVFVPGTLPGDRVRVRVTREQKRFVEAEVLQVLSPSPERAQPRCSVFGRCGGCQWQHVPYDRQWKTKVSGALHALARVGLTESRTLPREEFPALDPWSYRNRIQLRGGPFGLGFYARGSHEVVPIDRCEIAREEINRSLKSFEREAMARSGASKLELEVQETGELESSWNAPHAALGFRQVHDAQNRLLKEWISKKLLGGHVLLDLYGGSGNLSLGLASRYTEVHCVDRGAGRLIQKGLELSVPAHYRFYSMDVKKWAMQQRSAEVSISGGACILDPPREGCADAFGSILAVLERRGVDHLIAVGCDPDSWARDVARFSSRGWRVQEFAFFDFFPQTVHFESVAWLKRV